MADFPPLVRDTDFLPLPKLRSGKVREIYDLGEMLLIVATDRISAFDVVFPGGVPGKGILLTQIAAHWFRETTRIAENHLLSTEAGDLPSSLKPYADKLAGRFMLVRKARIFPVECIVRGHLAGSGWKAYKESGAICGVELPSDLPQAAELPEAIFTPSTKAGTGHDEHMAVADAKVALGEWAEAIIDISLRLYAFAKERLGPRGIIMADTKFEFGVSGGKLLLADEILTPDSSRFWPANDYRTGISPPSLDKQYLRDYLETLDWDKTPPGPELPDEIVANLLERYIEMHRIITGGPAPF